MSARVCQLCGKPLSRIRVGDGDFCSREHRNQFRLRQGMGRLQEASKVATVMRRRENLKPLAHTTASASSISPRGFFRVPLVSHAPQSLKRFGLAPGMAPVGITAQAERLAVHRSRQRRPQLPARRQAPPVKFTARPKPSFASSNCRTAARIERAPVARLDNRVAGRPASRREVGMARAASRRAAFDPHLKPHSEMGHGARGKQGLRQGPLPEAKKGNALRVSAASVFRVKAKGRAQIAVPPITKPRFEWRDKRHAVACATLPAHAARQTGSVAMATSPVRCPDIPALPGGGAFTASRPVDLRVRPVCELGTGIPRAGHTGFSPQTLPLMVPEPPDHLWARHAESQPHLPLKSRPARGRGEQQSALAPFVAEDVPCAYAFNVNLNGSKDQRR